jgi:cytidyltransferase-like protein
MTKVLVFGTFDGVHDGHRAMLKEAKALGTYLTVAVAPDAVAKALKGDTPSHTSGQRISLVRREQIADEVVLGDEELYSWKVLKKDKPNVVALGYDQHELRRSLEEFLERSFPDVETEEGWQASPKKPRIVTLSAYEPERFHNRLLHPKS